MPKRKRNPQQVPGDATDPYGMRKAVEDFIDYLRIHNYSESTIENRISQLSFLVVWLSERGITRPSEVTKPILERYQRSLFHLRKPNGAPLSFRTQHTRLIPVRLFFRWAAKTNRILYNPASELEMPRIEKRLPKHVLTIEEAEKVIALPNVENPMGIRDRSILEVFYSTGIRRREALNLRLYDIDVDRETVMVRQGKGKKDRMVPIGERALAWIERYLTDVRPALVKEPDEGWLFLTKDGDQLQPDTISGLVTTYIDHAGIGKRGSCHLFRHTMATLMLEGGADIRFIQQMLGHSELSTTQIYTQVSIRQLKQVHTATHPGATLARHREAHQPELDLGQRDDEEQELLSSLAAEAEEEQE